jgi:uncharacterized protein (TIGR03086 family)
MNRVDLGPGVEQLKSLLASIDDKDLAKPSPCPLFTVGNVIAHVGGFAQAFTAAARKERSDLVEHAPTGDPAPLLADWRTRIPNDLDTLVEAWRDPSAWEGMTRIAAMDAPAEMVGATVADEIVVHSWDIGRAVGGEGATDPALIETAMAFLTAFASPDAPAGEDVAFGPSRPAPANAAPLDEVLALAGRDPNWRGSS